MRESINKLIDEKIEEVHTMLPVKVTAYNAELHVADLQVLIKKQEEYPQLTNVPCYQFNNGTVQVLSPITVGVTGVVICFEKDIEQLLLKAPNQDCLSYRSFDLSDAFFMPIFNYEPNIIQSENSLDLTIKEQDKENLKLTVNKEGGLGLSVKDSIDIKVNKENEESKASLNINKEGKLSLTVQSSIDIKVKDKATITISDSGEVEMKAENIKITSEKTEITGDVDITGKLTVTEGIEVDGKELKDHTHDINYSVQAGGTTNLIATTPTGPAPVSGAVNEKTGGNN